MFVLGPRFQMCGRGRWAWDLRAAEGGEVSGAPGSHGEVRLGRAVYGFTGRFCFPPGPDHLQKLRVMSIASQSWCFTKPGRQSQSSARPPQPVEVHILQASFLPLSGSLKIQGIFVYGVRECSNFILLHVAVQFSQHHLLKRLSFLHCIFLPPLS